jgi:hypothetical protein
LKTSPDVQVVRSGGDVGALSGQQVQVEGIYRQQDVRMRPVGPPAYVGHVAIVLDDDTRVFLYPLGSAEAVRSTDEIQRFDQQRVRASGLLSARMPSQNATIKAPCLLQVTSLALAS